MTQRENLWFAAALEQEHKKSANVSAYSRTLRQGFTVNPPECVTIP